MAGPSDEDFRCSFWAGIVLDSEGRIYLADMGCNKVVRHDGDSKWTVIAGTGQRGSNGDGGPAERAELNAPSALAFDRAGNLYIADYGNLKVRVVHPDGTIATYAGNGRDDRPRGEGGPALGASIRPVALAAEPPGSVYVADFPGWVADPYYSNYAIRKITPDGNIATVLASSADKPEVVLPLSLVAPSSDLLYFGDLYRVRAVRGGTVQTIAGSLQLGFSGDGGPAADALLFAPQGLAVDVHGDVYVADIVNKRVRRIEFMPTSRTLMDVKE